MIYYYLEDTNISAKLGDTYSIYDSQENKKNMSNRPLKIYVVKCKKCSHYSEVYDVDMYSKNPQCPVCGGTDGWEVVSDMLHD